MTNEQRSNAEMPLMQRGGETDFLALQLVDAIVIASNPANGPKVYRQARREAVELARKIYRTACALAFREQLIASAAQGYQNDHYRADTFRSSHANLTPGRYTGD